MVVVVVVLGAIVVVVVVVVVVVAVAALSTARQGRKDSVDGSGTAGRTTQQTSSLADTNPRAV